MLSICHIKHQQQKFGCPLELCRVGVTRNITSLLALTAKTEQLSCSFSSNIRTRSATIQGVPTDPCDYTGCTNRPVRLYRVYQQTSATIQGVPPDQCEYTECTNRPMRLYRVYQQTSATIQGVPTDQCDYTGVPTDQCDYTRCNNRPVRLNRV